MTRTLKRHSRSDRDLSLADDEHEPVDPRDSAVDEDAGEAFDEETYEIFRVRCPDCARPIALLPDEDVLPEHALCPTPWNPFGLTVCGGSGRTVHEAAPAEGAEAAEEQELATVLTLPAGLDWRTQPFSHVGGPGSRPLPVPHRLAA